MTTFAHDTASVAARAVGGRRVASGLGFALVSALSFGLAGPLARGLLETGWSPGAIVLVRVGLPALVVLPAGILTLRGRWHLLGANAGLVLTYGLLAVAGAQFFYFSAVAHMQVGPALMIEYTAPAAVVVWLWLRRGERPGPVTLAGAALAAVGLVLVLDLTSGADLDLAGVLWALGAMGGVATDFLLAGVGAAWLLLDELPGSPQLAGGALILAGVVAVKLGEASVQEATGP